MKLTKNLTLVLALTSLFLGSQSFANTESIQAGEVNVLADIASIDKTEILLATLAINKKLNTEVTDFAQFMIAQHGANLNQVLEMANHFHIKALKSDQSNELSIQGNQAIMTLGGLSGDQFAKEYINAMVKGHESALNLIDNKLMKAAKTESIKNFLTATRAAVVEHLEHAKKAQESLK